MMLKTVALVSLCSVVLTCSARWHKKLEIGGMVGTTNYFGDINTMNPIHQIRPGAIVFGRYNYHSQLAFRSNLSFAMLSGSDKSSDFSYQVQRNIEFTSYVFGLSGVAEFNFLPFQSNKKKNVYSPYFSIGLGTNLVNKTFEKNIIKNIEIPISLGVKVNLQDKWTLAIEYSMRKLFRDDLDKLKYLLFSEGTTFNQRQITILQNNDWYSFLGIGIAYKLKGKNKCPAYTSSRNEHNLGAPQNNDKYKLQQSSGKNIS